MAQTQRPVEITLDDLLSTSNRKDLNNLLRDAAQQFCYDIHLDVAWDYWHFGRHAEHAKALAMPVMAKLFSVAWQIEHCVHVDDEVDSEMARTEIRDKYA